MEIKEMKEYLEAADVKVPEADEDVVAEFNLAVEMGMIELPEDEESDTDKEEAEAEDAPEEEVEAVEEKLITYIGAGDTPPYMINFMGRQQFMRGKAKMVTDPVILAKIENNPSFVEGEVDEDVLFQNDEAARQQAAKARARDKVLQAEADKRNKE